MPRRQLLLAALSTLLAGCTGVGGLFNPLAPERDASELTFQATDFNPEAYPNMTFCTPQEVYMVMPESGGKVGIVDVTFLDGEQMQLTGQYSGVEVAGDQKNRFEGDADHLQDLFGSAIVALPEAPMYETVYFKSGTTRLVEQSQSVLDAVVTSVAKRTHAELRLTGHTDTVGGDAFNERLSLKRAHSIKSLFVQHGVPEQTIAVEGMGESRLLVNTADNVNELHNRRVEISVR